jgi:hypothetical protein
LGLCKKLLFSVFLKNGLFSTRYNVRNPLFGLSKTASVRAAAEPKSLNGMANPSCDQHPAVWTPESL